MQCKGLDSSRYVCANVSTQVVDRDGDLADVKQYVEAGQKLVEDGGMLTKNHSNKIIGTVWKIEEGIDGGTQLPCVVAYMNYFRGTMLYDQSWQEFKAGRTEYSIGSYTKKPERECDMKGCHYRLIPEQWFELSNVDRGINPITYPVEVNDVAKGTEIIDNDDSVPKGTIIDMHDDICPAKAKYMRFKETMKSYGHDTYYDDNFILIHGLLGEDEMAYIYQEYPDIREFEILRGEGEEDDYTFIAPKADMTDDMLHDMIHLMLDEQEAIEGYNTVMGRLEGMVAEFGEEAIDKVQKIFNEIKHDEEKHIGGILEAIKVLDPDMYSQIADGMKESRDEAKKGECPAGQHEHAGVWGCHDIYRRHHMEDKTLPTDKLDLTDENIDVNAIQDTPTEKLRDIVTRIAKVLSKYSDNQVQEFLSSTPGKEFVLAFLELKRRKMNGENNMTEKEAGCSKAETIKAEEAEMPVEETEKGMIPDIQSSIANISSTLASITAVIDQMNIRLMKLEDSDLMGKSEAQGTSITDAIMNEATDGAPAIPEAEEAEEEGGEDKGAVPPQFEKTDDDEAEESSEDKDEDKDEEKSETEVKVETKEEDESEDKDSEDKDESESKEEDKEESEDKEEKKESDDDSDKTEEKKTEEKKEEKKEDEEKKKGTSEEPQPQEVLEPKEDTVAEVAPSTEDAVVPTDEKEPVVEEAKQEVPAVDEPKATVVEPKVPPVTEPVKEMELPIPKGGQAVDFRAMLLSRQSELKAKGVELYIAEEGAQNSLANVPIEHIKGTNVTLIRPSNNIQAFDAEMGLKAHSSKDAWKMMGSTTDSTNFLKKLIGE